MKVYDVVIVGAGISGLVCGCYLAKRGKKVLLLERKTVPGGYCSSFERNGFIFDACVHSIGGLRKSGVLRKIFDDFDIDNDLSYVQYAPSDILRSEDYCISFSRNLNDVVDSFTKNFPCESRNFRNFFEIFSDNYQDNLTFFQKLRSMTFKDLLDTFFKSKQVKGVLSLPLLGNAGLPSSLMSATFGYQVYKEFMLDGGYYPIGGMQEFSNTLYKKFISLGGEAVFSSAVEDIDLKGFLQAEIHTSLNRSYDAKIVVLSCDPRSILKSKSKFRKYNDLTGKLKPSLSAFSVYICAEIDGSEVRQSRANLWHVPNYDIDKMYKEILSKNVSGPNIYTIAFSSRHHQTLPSANYETVVLFVNAPYANLSFWKENRDRIAKEMIKKNIQLIPSLKKIKFFTISDPATLYRQTLNSRGAAYGWAEFPSQTDIGHFFGDNILDGIFFTGNWTTQGHGVGSVAYCAKKTAFRILGRLQD